MYSRNAKELGYKVGDLFELLPSYPEFLDGSKQAGDILMLFHDDGSKNPTFVSERTKESFFITMESVDGIPYIRKIRHIPKLDLI